MKSQDSLKFDINNKFNNISNKLVTRFYKFGWFSGWKPV